MADLDTVKSRSGVNRRSFLELAVSAASGLALAPLLSPSAEGQVPGALCVATTGTELRKAGEIVRGSDGVLRGLIDLQVEKRSITYYNAGVYACGQYTLRAYQGYQGFTLDPKKRVTLVGVASPGPTLRAAVGDRIELIFLNRIDPAKFNATSVTSSFGHCDTTHSLSGGGVGGGPYPNKDADNFPNCFHASNTTNLHFHGTHTDPGGFGDNVLVGVVPQTHMDPAVMIQRCTEAYGAWGRKQDPTKNLQQVASITLNAMLQRAQLEKNSEVAAQLNAAVTANTTDKSHGEWPQYWPGYYPYYFDLPVYSGNPKVFPVMGQAPGTHWYHCHQHGSTALQLLNGMAGALIITGDYDDKILRLGGGTPENPKIKEHIMVMQLFSEQTNQVMGGPGPTVGTVAVNGQVLPTVTVKQGEVQWWRLVNACMKAHGIERFLFLNEATFQDLVNNPSKMKNGQPPQVDQNTVPRLNQCAQDGVQLDWKNYQRRMGQPTFHLAPGNRIDFLVQAPKASGNCYLVFWPPAGGPPAITDIRSNTFLKVIVDGPPAGENTDLPTEAQYPELPPFLHDITDAEINGRHRNVTFSMVGGIGTQPRFFIDGKQFNEGIIDQTMMKGTAEEWTLINTSLSSIQHPFHIHINPFQITEIYDPAQMSKPQTQLAPWVWGDVIAIPAGVQQTDAQGNPMKDAQGNPIITPGHVRIRSRFVDFIGKYVLHCHILGHEDRGMMQLVQVVDNTTVVRHH